jgi:hypothetical protein
MGSKAEGLSRDFDVGMHGQVKQFDAGEYHLQFPARIQSVQDWHGPDIGFAKRPPSA